LDNRLINVSYALKFSFGLALVALGYKLNKLKDNTFGLNIFGMIMKVCGILYAFSGIPYAGIAVLIYAEIIQIFIAIAFSVLFLRAAKDTEKPFTEVKNTPTHLI
jgi:hypothetical protein